MKQTIKDRQADGVYWIRPEGKGNLVCSPVVKTAVEKVIERGRPQVVVDLQGVKGMDSTFMGMLTGLALRLKEDGQRLNLAGVSEANLDSLEDLGVDDLMDIDPPEAIWRGKADEFRDNLEPLDGGSKTDMEDHILKCHRNLSDLSKENENQFRTLLSILEGQRA